MTDTAKGRRYAAILLIASIAVLTVGTLVRRRGASELKPVPAAIDLEILQRLTADRRLRDLSGYLAEKAQPGARRLSEAGLAWDAQTVIAPPDGRGLPFTVRRQPSDFPPAVLVHPKPGDWLIAVARDGAGASVFAHGLFEGVAKERCGSFEYEAVHFAVPLAPTLIGGGVFLIDGGLAAFIGACNGRAVAIASSTIADVLAHPPSPADLLEQRYGFRRDDQGVVTSVWGDSDADRAGLRPGDVVDLDADPPAIAQRRGRQVRLDWPGGPPEARGITFSGASVAAVAPGSPADSAGILAGDRVVRINGASAADPAATLDRARGPVTVTIDRDGRRRETLLQP